MKILVRREESFGEAVPAIAKFIHFVRAEHVVIGKRHQLHACRCEGVETGQLPARRGQGRGNDCTLSPKKYRPVSRLFGLKLWSILAMKLVSLLKDGDTTEALLPPRFGAGQGCRARRA